MTLVDEFLEKLDEAKIATKTMWDIREANGKWRNLNIDPLNATEKAKAIAFVEARPGLSVGPNGGAGIDSR
jgi:hypothetical protein